MKSKISFKLILTVGLISVSIIVIFSIIINDSIKKSLLNQIDHNANQLSDTVKSSTKYDMLLNQRDRIHKIIDTIGKQEGIEKIRIFNKEGIIIYSSKQEDIGKLLNKDAESCYACHAANKPLEKLTIKERSRIFNSEKGYKTFGIINPIYNEPSCWQSSCHAHDSKDKILGVLDVTLSLKEVEKQISFTQTNLFIFAFFSVLSISLILWLLVHRFIGLPVLQLLKATNNVASGDLDYKIPVLNTDEIGQLANSFNDMTQKLKTVQRQLFQSDKLASIGQLAAGVAHEINNPLTGILTYSSFLLKRAENDSEVKADLEIIVRETKRCREIVKGLLDFSRQVPPQKNYFSINDLVHKSIIILENQLIINNITLQTHLSAGLPDIFADSGQIQQVLINLIVNAIDAVGNGGGRIEIITKKRVAPKYNSLILEVKDTGCGISQENLSKIFEPFYSTKGTKGTGLGLAIVWGIITKHGGKIEASRDEQNMTKFSITLPVFKEAGLPDEKNRIPV